MVHGLSCSVACGILPDQESNPCPPALAGGFLTTAPPGKCPHHHLLKRLSFSIVHSLFPCHELIIHICMGLFPGSQLCSIDLCICFSANIMLFWLLWLYNIVLNQSVWYLQLCSFYQDCFGCSGSLWFHVNLRIFYSIFAKNILGTLIEIALNLKIALGNIDIWTMLFLPIHECRILFHLFVSSGKGNTSKSKQTGLHQTKKFLHSKGNQQQNEKGTYLMEEDTCKSYIR